MEDGGCWGKGGGESGGKGEEGIGSGEVEQILDALVDAAQEEGAAEVGEFGVGEDEESEAGAIHVADGGHVEDDVAVACGEGGFDLGLDHFEGRAKGKRAVEGDFDGLIWELGEAGVEWHGHHFS
jgi:hypothetical protein